MFDFFKRKKAGHDDVVLPFKSNEAAFEYCCRFMNCQVGIRVSFPALVLDATEEFGTAVPVLKGENGI
jgi:hypothetical protein